jgi:tetratricopeptide (TPR) repeat protein
VRKRNSFWLVVVSVVLAFAVCAGICYRILEPPGSVNLGPLIPHPNPTNRNEAIADAAARIALADVGSPLDAMARDAAQDPQLADWLAEWQADVFAGRPISAESQANLEEILKDSPLPCRKLAKIARSVYYYTSVKNPITPAIISAAVMHRGDKELAAYKPGDPQAKPILLAMDSINDPLWRVTDTGDPRFVDSLYLQYRDMIRWASPNDASMRGPRTYAYIGKAECLLITHKRAEALSVIQEINTSLIPKSQQSETAWVEAETLFELKRYPEAVTQLQRCFGAGGFPGARELLAECYAKMGQIAQANTAFDDWVRRERPTEARAMATFQEMNLSP